MFSLLQRKVSIHIPNATGRNYLNINLLYAVAVNDGKCLSAFSSTQQPNQILNVRLVIIALIID